MAPRWHWHSSSGSCRQFTFGGCGGNRNNFLTAGKCSERCGGQAKELLTKDKEMTQESRVVKKGVQEVVKGGQKVANGYQEVAIEDQEAASFCLSAPSSGRCRGRELRYYWDPARSACAQFEYGGCAGNRNNFLSEQQCRQTCSLVEMVVEEEEEEPAVSQNKAVQHTVAQHRSPCSMMLDAGDCTGNTLR